MSSKKLHAARPIRATANHRPLTIIPRKRRLLPQFFPNAERAEFRETVTTSKLLVRYLRYHNRQSMGLRKPKSIKHHGTSLADILEAHERFFSGKDGGVRADLTGADLSHADLSEANLSGSILRKADLRNTDMTEAILPGADLTEAQASGVEFFRCDLSNVNFQRAHLRNVNLRLANVSGAKFSGADMGVAVLRETDLTGADLSGVDLSTALLPRGFALPQAAKKSA